MCRSCVLHMQTTSLTLCTNSLFYTGFFNNRDWPCISTFYTRLYTRLEYTLINIKKSLNTSVKLYLSTVSTPPITTTTILNFNETVIILRNRSRNS